MPSPPWRASRRVMKLLLATATIPYKDVLNVLTDRPCVPLTIYSM